MTATQALALLLLIVGSCAIAALARRHGVAAPILLVVTGIAASYIPGVPEFRLSPNLVLFAVLPPLVYTTALESSYLNLRDNVRTLALLSVGLVLFTAVVVGGAAQLDVPGLPLAAALTLGAILAPTDAVTTASIGRQLHLPRRLLTVITGESMLNDGTALTLYAVAVSAAATLRRHPLPAQRGRPPDRDQRRRGRRGPGTRRRHPPAPDAAARPAGGEHPVAPHPVRRLPGRRLAARVRDPGRRGDRPVPRPPCRPGPLRHPAAGHGRVAGRHLRARVGGVRPDRPAAAPDHPGSGQPGSRPAGRRGRRRARRGHRGPHRVGVPVHLPAPVAGAPDPGAGSGAPAGRPRSCCPGRACGA